MDEEEFDAIVRSTMARLTQDFEGDTGGIEDRLATVTAAAVDLIDGVDYADVLLIEQGRFRSMTPTAEVTVRLDDVQQELDEGPCLAAAISDPLVRCPDLRTDERWPRFGAVAAESGVLSMLSYQLYTHHSGRGALNLFGATPQAFTAEAEAVGAMLATHAAALLIAANRQRQFQSALAGRDMIGQAKGIIMERFKVDATRAFELLTQLSQESNTPLRTIAQQIVDRTTG